MIEQLLTGAYLQKWINLSWDHLNNIVCVSANGSAANYYRFVTP